MINNKQPLRYQYENALRHMRAGGFDEKSEVGKLIEPTIKRKAFHSLIDYRLMDFTGWLNNERRALWLDLRGGVDPLNDIPF